MIAGDKVSVTVFVEVPIDDAFEVFTEEIDRWWRRGPAYRLAGDSPGTIALEPRLGGKLVETYGEGKTRDVGVITVWEPPTHIVFEWRAFNFEPGEITTVELFFEASGEGTRVKLEHRGWASIRSDHPVRHGKPVDAFIRDLAMWWGGLMRSYLEATDQNATPLP